MKNLLLRILGVVAALSTPLLISTAARAGVDTCTWTGGGTTNIFSDSANWGDGAGPVVECDVAGIPENGDQLVFLTSVDSDTTDGDDRILNNDISSLSIAGITVSGGNYPTGDIDNYRITGNSITLTGNIIGAPGTSYTRPILFESVLVAGGAITIESVNSSTDLSIGSNNVTIRNSYFEGALSGTGTVTFSGFGLGGGQGGGDCTFGSVNVADGWPFAAASTSFTGPIIIGTYGSITVAGGSSVSFASNASSITVQDEGTLNFLLSNGQDKTFSTPLTLTGGMITSYQVPADSGCDPATPYKTLTISGSVSVSGSVDVSMTRSNITFSGAVTGGSNLSVPSGGDPDSILTVGSTQSRSAELLTTYTGNQSGTAPSIPVNQKVVVSSGATLGNVDVSGGTLKGSGTVGTITMSDGTVAPGLSPGCLSSGNLTFTGGTLEIEINGATVCTEYDQQTVVGTVALGTATTLDIARLTTYVPALNSTYTIISNDASDAVTGTFAGLAQGATTVVDGVTYTVSYTGGDGNDVVLTVTAIAASVGAPNTGAHIIKSGIILPLIAVAAAVGIIAMNFVSTKKKQIK